MTEHHTHGDADEVEAVIQTFLDYLEGAGPEPTLDHLDEEARHEAAALIESLRAGRGMDPYASRPSIETMLAGTEFEDALPVADLTRTGDDRGADTGPDAAGICEVVSSADPRGRIEVEHGEDGTETIVLRHLDLRVRFLLLDAPSPAITDEVRAVLARQLSHDPDVEYFGVVASLDQELSTQLLSAADLGPTTMAPYSDAQASWTAVLPLAWATRRVVELGAPEWESFDLDADTIEPLDVKTVATQTAHEVIAREAGRAYRGDKARAYQSLVGRERAFVDLAEQVAARGAVNVDLQSEAWRIAREAA